MRELRGLEPNFCLNPKGKLRGCRSGIQSQFWSFLLRFGRRISPLSVLGTDLQPLFLQSLKMVKMQSSTAEIESILDSDQRDLIGDFSKVTQAI